MRVLWLTILLAAASSLAVATEPGEPAGAAVSPKPTGPLSALESRFQGGWQAYDFQTNRPLYKMTFDGRNFRAEAEEGWYEGYVAIRSDAEPAHLDFVIEDCSCGFKGQASTGIFYWDGETIVVSAPDPGAARPQEFKEAGGSMFRMKRAGAAGKESEGSPG